ncbi:MAG TPA: PDZ domain-containing protein [Candidatus Udaeobacter sp.]|nr:PDZ domain-containing protein [Candidatus Udaeobacter sp.]
MKIKFIAIIASVAFLAIAGFAQTPPTPPQPPAPPHPPGLPGDHEKPPKVPAIFLGVETSQVPTVVSEQLGLSKGLGLVVEYVVPDSPAAAAGIQQNDILKMLNDQILIEPSQLRKLLQTFSDGADVTLTILRKGQEQKVNVKLTKKERPQRHSWTPGDKHESHWDFDDTGDLGEQMQGLKEQLQEQLGAQRGIIRGAVMKAHEAARRAREDARRAAREIRILSKDHGTLKATRIDLGQAQIVFSDDKGEMKLENVDGKKILTAKDTQGKLLFSGPVETKEDRDKMPADVRERYEKLQQNDLPAVAPETDADEEDDDDEDATQSTDTVCAQPCFHWCVIRSGARDLTTTKA